MTRNESVSRSRLFIINALWWAGPPVFCPARKRKRRKLKEFLNGPAPPQVCHTHFVLRFLMMRTRGHYVLHGEATATNNVRHADDDKFLRCPVSDFWSQNHTEQFRSQFAKFSRTMVLCWTELWSTRRSVNIYRPSIAFYLFYRTSALCFGELARSLRIMQHHILAIMENMHKIYKSGILAVLISATRKLDLFWFSVPCFRSPSLFCSGCSLSSNRRCSHTEANQIQGAFPFLLYTHSTHTYEFWLPNPRMDMNSMCFWIYCLVISSWLTCGCVSNFLTTYFDQMWRLQITGSERFGKVIEFLRKQLHQDSIVSGLIIPLHLASKISKHNRDLQFVYINSAFAPNPDETVRDLFEVKAHPLF